MILRRFHWFRADFVDFELDFMHFPWIHGFHADFLNFAGHIGAHLGDKVADAVVVGQVIVFRASRAMVLRYMEWPDFSEKQAEVIQEQIEQNIIAMLSHGEK